MSAIKAWHFLADSGLLRDGTPPPADGEWLCHDGPVSMCKSGLHASRNVTDAIQYARDPVVCRVECRDIVAERADKLVCRQRRILWRMDATDVLRAFARECALDVIHLWDAPEIVVRYLRTGDESIRAAAGAAAWAAAGAAAWAAAGAAAWAAARDAAWAAARDAAWAAARDAARAAAWAAAWAAARAAARAKQERRLVAMLNATHRRSA